MAQVVSPDTVSPKTRFERHAMHRFPVRRALISLASIAVPLALAACSGVSADWVKPGLGEDRIRADNAVCRAEADQAHGRSADISRDIQASRPRGLNDVGDRSERLRSYDTEQSYDKIFGACMAAHGYSRRGGNR